MKTVCFTYEEILYLSGLLKNPDDLMWQALFDHLVPSILGKLESDLDI